jgi:hypothetical protein
MEEIIKEGKWICPNCSTKNTGSLQKCPACGAIRGEVEFIYEEDGEVVADEEGKKKALAGADWVCPFCDNTNPAETNVCQGCSAPRTEGKNRQVKELDASGKPKGKPGPKPPTGAAKTPPKAAGPLPGCIKYPLIAFGLFIVVAIILQSMSYPQTLEVVGKNWERQAVIQAYQTLTKEDWLGSVPTTGRIKDRSQKIRSYKKVKIGEKDVEETYTEKVKVGTKKVKVGVVDLGNGRFKEQYEDQPVYENKEKKRRVKQPVYREDPVYDTWARFDNDEWKEVGKPEAKGNEEKEPFWPVDNTPDQVSNPSIGAKKHVKTGEKYQIRFRSTKDQKEYTEETINGKPLTADLYGKFKKGEKFESVISGLGSIKEVKLPW